MSPRLSQDEVQQLQPNPPILPPPRKGPGTDSRLTAWFCSSPVLLFLPQVEGRDAAPAHRHQGWLWAELLLSFLLRAPALQQPWGSSKRGVVGVGWAGIHRTHHSTSLFYTKSVYISANVTIAWSSLNIRHLLLNLQVEISETQLFS